MYVAIKKKLKAGVLEKKKGNISLKSSNNILPNRVSIAN